MAGRHSLRAGRLAASQALPWLAFLGCLAWLFYPGLVASKVPAFRDAYHFYYPQAVWLERCAEQATYFPSWNPDEGLGVSITGQPSAALYYPLRPLWWLPGLDTAQKFSLFIVAHLLIAAIGAHWAARQLNLSGQAAWLAAVSYSLSCPVYFQHTNLIYLCSAAWVGFALSAIFAVMQATDRSGFVGSCIVFAAATSMMLLGGDPQTAVNSFLIAGVIFATVCAQHLWSLRSRGQPTLLTQRADFSGFSLFARNCGWLVAAAALFAMLSLVQWLPSWRWASHSGRAAPNISREPTLATPPSGTLAHRTSLTPAVDAALQESSSPRHHRYDFSLSPWHLLTCIWPTAGGHYLPNNSRIFSALPAEGRMWIPSLFFGCWPCLLFLLAAFKKSQRPWVLLVIATVALLASLGNYSIVWILREMLSSLGLTTLAERLPADHVGSLAGLLNTCLPGYSMFRYPAKWTVWFSAAACLIAATQFNDLSVANLRQWTRRYRQTIGVCSLAGLVAAVGLWFADAGFGVDHWLSQVAPDRWLGPPNARSIAISLAIACLIPLLSFRIGSLESALGKRLLPSIALITLIEMTFCASCWTSFLPAPLGHLDSRSQWLEAQLTPPPTAHPHRPFVWANFSRADLQRDHCVQSPQSFEIDQADYQQVWLLGKLGLLPGIRCLNATQSIEPIELSQLRAWLSRHDRLLNVQPDVDRVLRELGITHRLVRTQFDNQPSQFVWRAIAAPQPLCQLALAGREQPSEWPKIEWRWHGPDRLDLQIAAPQVAVLLIRQFNDGGWSARNQQEKRLPIDRDSLFVQIPLTAEDSQIRLTRNWFQ